MRAAILIYIYILLSIVDHVTTWILIDANLGEETNPHVYTDSLSSIFFSPIPLVLDAAFLACVFLAEKFDNNIHSLLVKRHPAAPLCLFPLFGIWMLSVIAMSNTFGALGFGTPLAWFASLFDFITEERHELIRIALIVINIAALPVITRIAIRIYTPSTPASAVVHVSSHT